MSDHPLNYVIFENDDGDQLDTYEIGLYLSSRSIESPEPQTYTVEIPGRDGPLDLTESLDGYVHYDNREVKMEFLFMGRENWESIYSELAQFLQGRKVKIYFPDEMDCYFYGRCTIGDFDMDSSTNYGGNFEVVADCDPWRYTGDYSYSVDSSDFKTRNIDLVDNWYTGGYNSTKSVYFAKAASSTKTAQEEPCKYFDSIRVVYTLSEARHCFVRCQTTDTYDSTATGGINTETATIATIHLDEDTDSVDITISEADDGTITATCNDDNTCTVSLTHDAQFTEIYHINAQYRGIRSTTITSGDIYAVAKRCAKITLKGAYNHPTIEAYADGDQFVALFNGEWIELEDDDTTYIDSKMEGENEVLYIIATSTVVSTDEVEITYTGGKI